VEENLLCYSCQGEPLIICQSSCGDQMRTAIRRMIKEGKTKQEILDVFVAQFGEAILTVPPKRGFNLVAYILPFVGLIVGGVVVVVFLRRSRSGPRAKGDTEGGEEPPDLEVDEKLKKKIDEELDKLE
jgi:cytochrome c-type biogenesis protein CcmH